MAASIVGCSAAPPDEHVDRQSAANVTFPNDKAAFDYFRAKGLTAAQAAGIVGNLDQESGVDPTAVQPGGPGRGIAQWSVGGRWDTDGSDNATWFASTKGESLDSLQLQLDFIWYELTTFSGYGLSSLQAATTVTAATVAFETDFEGCGTCDESQRIAYANNVLATFGGDPVDGGAVVPDAGGTPCVVTTTGESGECLPTASCAAMAGYASTPGYCPGAADIQCCTPIPGFDAGPIPPPDAGATDTGASPHVDSGTPASGDASLDAAVDGGPDTNAESAPDARSDVGGTIPNGGGVPGASNASGGCGVGARATPRRGMDAAFAALLLATLRRRRRSPRAIVATPPIARG